MSCERSLRKAIRRVGVEAIEVVQLFEQRRIAEASARASFIANFARRVGLESIASAAQSLKDALRSPARSSHDSISSGLAALIIEVEYASAVLDPLDLLTES